MLLISMKVTLRVTCARAWLLQRIIFFNTVKKQKVLGTFPLVHNASFSRVTYIFNVLIEFAAEFLRNSLPDKNLPLTIS